MRTQIFQIDAFTSRRFAGNPAAIMPLARFLSDETMQAIAAENNLAETAFLVRENGDYRIRWFTPAVEVPLCGHATLASAAVIMEKLEPQRSTVVFHSASGPLTVNRSGSRYVMDFPARSSDPVPPQPALANALGAEPVELFANEFCYMAVLQDAKTVRELSPDFNALEQLDRETIIATAEGDQGYDFISRFFAPGKGINEDPVTGSAHCTLAPYWARRLGKTELRAWQASSRGGEITCRVKQDRVELEGECVFYLEGYAEI